MNKSLFKKGKFGELPGDISRRSKIRMLEKKEAFNVFPWQRITVGDINSYRNDHYKKLNRRFRKGNKVVLDSLPS